MASWRSLKATECRRDGCRFNSHSGYFYFLPLESGNKKKVLHWFPPFKKLAESLEQSVLTISSPPTLLYVRYNVNLYDKIKYAVFIDICTYYSHVVLEDQFVSTKLNYFYFCQSMDMKFSTQFENYMHSTY